MEAPTGSVLGIVERERAYSTVHEGAIYLHLGESYLVRELDLRARAAVVTSYSGDYYSDNTSADAAEPPPPSPVTPSLPTWRNLYDWPNGHGYAGWHTASSSQSGAYGMRRLRL